MLKWALTGGFLPILLIGGGLFFLLYLRFRPFRHPIRMWRAMRTPSAGDGISPFRAVTLALAGTLGVGNIVGVANALWVGGAGAVFWMWLSALVAMVLKYAEILLAVSHRRCGKHGFFGGAYYYIKDYFTSHNMLRTATVLSALFAVLMIVTGLGMGCIVQVNAVSYAFRGVLHVPTWLSGALLAFITLPVIVRGTKGVSALCELLVPIMTLGFLILSATILIVRRDVVGAAFVSIFREAFSPTSIGGGLIGVLTSRAIQSGTIRGLLSNEAGCGTAPTAHAAANAKSPAAQGVWGIFEVFVDTILLCTVTALVILVSFDEVSFLAADGVMMTIRAYSVVLGDWAEWFFVFAVLAFGYATLICWANYGLECLRFLSPKTAWRYLYFAIFAIAILVGAVVAPESVWLVADVAVTALTVINLSTLFLLRREVKRETDRFCAE